MNLSHRDGEYLLTERGIRGPASRKVLLGNTAASTLVSNDELGPNMAIYTSSALPWAVVYNGVSRFGKRAPIAALRGWKIGYFRPSMNLSMAREPDMSAMTETHSNTRRHHRPLCGLDHQTAVRFPACTSGIRGTIRFQG